MKARLTIKEELDNNGYTENEAFELVELAEKLVQDLRDFRGDAHGLNFRVNDNGSKYIKIIETRYGDDNSVWGFINKGNHNFPLGAVLKPAGWSGPAKNFPRGNLFDGFEINQATEFGPLTL